MGIKISCKIKGLDKLEKKTNKIIKELPQKVEESIEDVLKNIQGCAIRLLGTDNNGIVCETVNTSTKKIEGRVFTDKNKMPWSWFREFGTRNLCRATTHRYYKAFPRKSVLKNGIYL